jgi:hypothetical protein
MSLGWEYVASQERSTQGAIGTTMYYMDILSHFRWEELGIILHGYVVGGLTMRPGIAFPYCNNA